MPGAHKFNLVLPLKQRFSKHLRKINILKKKGQEELTRLLAKDKTEKNKKSFQNYNYYIQKMLRGYCIHKSRTFHRQKYSYKLKNCLSKESYK